MTLKEHPDKKGFYKHPRLDIWCSREGIIYRDDLDREIVGYRQGHGYLVIRINNISHRVSRLMAECFLPLPKGKTMDELEVNHKNGIRHDNRVSNLEWVDKSTNIKHSWDMRKNK